MPEVFLKVMDLQVHVNDNPTIVRTDESHVGYVESSHLVKFVGYHFKQSVYAVELRLSPQTRVGCLRSIALQKIPFFHRIRNFAFFVQYSVLGMLLCPSM